MSEQSDRKRREQSSSPGDSERGDPRRWERDPLDGALEESVGGASGGSGGSAVAGADLGGIIGSGGRQTGEDIGKSSGGGGPGTGTTGGDIDDRTFDDVPEDRRPF